MAVLLAPGLAQPQPPEVGALLARLVREPNNAALRQQIGVAYLRAQQLEKAASYFRKALAIDPDLVPARKNLGTALWFAGRKAESEQEFRRVVASRPEDPVAHLYLGLAAYGRKQFPQVVAHFEKAGDLVTGNPEVRPLAVESLLGAAAAFDARKSPQRAYDAYRKALELDPGSVQVYLAFSGFAAAHGNAGYAEKVIEQGLSRLPGSAELILQRGIVAGLRGDLDAAERDFRRAASASPSVEPLLALGVAALQRGKADEAAAEFRSASEKAPRDSRCHYLLALALSRSGAPDRAIPSLHQALSLKPDDSRTLALLGQLEVQGGRLDTGAEHLEKALKTAPDDATTLYQLALAYRKQGKNAEAERVLQRFRKARSRREENALVLILKTMPHK